MKKKTKIVLSIVCSIVLIIAVVIGGFSIYSNKKNDKLQAYLADTSNPPKALENPDEWVETFHDDFNTFDTTKWKSLTFKEYGNSRRAAYYTGDEESIFTKDGKLYLRTEWKDGKYGEGWYSAYLVSSKNNYSNYNTSDFEGFNQNEGYFEIRCKFPNAYNIWSSFWLMPDNQTAFGQNDIVNSAEDGVEIDIFESFYYVYLNPKDKYSISPVIHCDQYGVNQKTISDGHIFIPNLYNHYHNFGLLWEDNTYTFYVDGIEICKIEHIIDGIDMGPCLVPEYLILSTEIMGQIKNGVVYEGYQLNEDANIITKLDQWNSSPSRNNKKINYDFIIDYVRVYKKK